MKNVATTEVWGHNTGVQIRESRDEPAPATYRPSTSYDPNGKGNATMLGNEEENQPCQPRMSFEENKNKVHTFRRDKSAKLFQQALMSVRLMLPAPTRPEQAMMIDDPNYCLYHWSISHSIDDYFPFKDRLQSATGDQVFTLSGSHEYRQE